MTAPTFVLATFYTFATEYENVFNKYYLPSAMDLQFKYGLDWHVGIIENKGSWIKNVAEKPRVILDRLITMVEIKDNRNLLFVDCDCIINEYPAIFDTIECDIAYHKLDWGNHYGHSHGKKELLSGTLFFRNNKKVRELVAEWYDRASISNKWEQVILEEVINENKGACNFKELDVRCCAIKTLPNGQPPKVICENPVIEHFQISRLYRKSIR